ncbi:hypothetical protein F5Y10DRAFT_266482 [Nemania abortiva]|nr:hypothetical protein F5Y10DRAFT_266482 [Nemania abortiva]
MWNLLFLIALMSVSNKGADHLSRITKWLEEISQYIRASNNHYNSVIDSKTVSAEVDLSKQIAVCWLKVITAFESQEMGEDYYASATSTLTRIYQSAYKATNDARQHDKKITEIAERLAHIATEDSMSRRILSLECERDGAILPCNTLPVAENGRFFGQQDILEKLELHLTPSDTRASLSSVALHGLGGIGKTQIALAYAHQKTHDLDAVLWIYAETVDSIEYDFSSIAVDALQLAEAKPGDHQHNIVLVMNWLRNTSAKWLLVFDNVVSGSVFESFWPVSNHGAIIVTTRNPFFGSFPADFGMEVCGFDERDGAEFLLQMALHRRRNLDGEIEAARRVSRDLGGLPLAISQMAALINARNYTIAEFADIYAKHGCRLHGETKPGWVYLGYENALDSVWEDSFKKLGESALSRLKTSSFLDCGQLRRQIFMKEILHIVLEGPDFYDYESIVGNDFEELVRHGLVQSNPFQGTYHIHRLVQRHVQANIVGTEKAQEVFEAAAGLLLDKLPSERKNKYDDEEWILYSQYIPHVLALTRNYEHSQSTSTSLKPSIIFVDLLINAANAIHDNDFSGGVPVLLDTATSAFMKWPEESRHDLTWAFLLSVKGMYHLTTAEFIESEKEIIECLKIRERLLPSNDLLISLAYSWLGMAVGGQGRYAEGLDFLEKAGKILEGPAGDAPTRKQVWRYNISRNYYCMGKYDEAEQMLIAAMEEAEGWYQEAYGHLTFASLWTRMGRLSDAKTRVDIAKNILEKSGMSGHRGWLYSYCAYRAGIVAMLQGRIEDAIAETKKAVTFGKRDKVPIGILSRCTHAYSKALGMDASRQEDSEKQRLEARRLRSEMPSKGGNLDDESDEAFDMLVKMDHR